MFVCCLICYLLVSKGGFVGFFIATVLLIVVIVFCFKIKILFYRHLYRLFLCFLNLSLI